MKLLALLLLIPTITLSTSFAQSEDSKKSKKIIAAVRSGDLEAVKEYLKGNDINAKLNDDNETLLTVASDVGSDRKDDTTGQEQVQLYLIKNGADLSKKGIYGFTPLDLATQTKKSLPMLKNLLENGVKLNLDNIEGIPSNAILSAAANQGVEGVKLLLEIRGKEIDINKVYHRKNLAPHNYTVMGMALQTQNEDLVDFLISQGAEVRDIDREAILTNLKEAEDKINESIKGMNLGSVSPQKFCEDKMWEADKYDKGMNGYMYCDNLLDGLKEATFAKRMLNNYLRRKNQKKDDSSKVKSR